VKVLVAGATGAIGRPLISCLKESGHAVFGLVRSSDSESDLVEMGAEAVTVDALDAASVKAAIQRIRPDAIINGLTSSFVHIEDAAAATVAALRCAPGAYNIVDDDPSEQRVWLPAFARACGAPEPPQATEQQALATSGADSVYYATRLRGASNEKAKRELNFRPRPLEWLQTA
jgi:nucleoside-diphosphate-sugar epimerase